MMYGILSATAILFFIIAISCNKGRNPGQTTSELDHRIATSSIEESIFPTAIFTPELKIITLNKNLRKNFLPHTDNEITYLPEITSLWQDQEMLKILNMIKLHKKITDNPAFVKFNIEKDEGQSENYVVIFRYFEQNHDLAPFFSLTLVNARYTMRVAEDLFARIAEKESNLKKLEEVDRLKSEFLATLSHELKTPLVSIKGYLDLIASEKMGPLTDKQAKALKVSLKNTSHLNSMISSMLNFARMEAGKLMFDLVQQKLTPRINETIDSMRPIAENRNVILQTDFAENLPAVIFDPELMHRVMCNLLENAIKFSPQNSIVLVSISEHSPRLIKVQVSDQGCGIPDDKIEMIKTPFYQVVKSDTRPTSGLGIGLAICEKILVGHGTSLHIESKENAGTSCSFYLKIAPAS